MKVHGLEQVLQDHPFFKDLPESFLHAVAGCAKNVRYESGDFLFREQGEANEFYLVRAGQIALEVNSPKFGPISIQTIHEGEVVGWAWLFAPYRWYFDARIQKPVRAISVNAKCLRTKCENDPALGYELMKRFAGIMIKNLQSTRLQLIDTIEEAREHNAQ